MPAHLYPADHGPPENDLATTALANCAVVMAKARPHLAGLSEKELEYFDQVLSEAISALEI